MTELKGHSGLLDHLRTGGIGKKKVPVHGNATFYYSRKTALCENGQVNRFEVGGIVLHSPFEFAVIHRSRIGLWPIAVNGFGVYQCGKECILFKVRKLS